MLIEVKLLGPVEVLVAGRLVDVPRGRVQALLAVLALSAGQPVAAETLTARVWGSAQPTDVMASLYSTVRRLRSVLGNDAITVSAAGYALEVEPDAVDALRFGRLLDRADGCSGAAEQALLREALALWRGTPVLRVSTLVEQRLAAVERLALISEGAEVEQLWEVAREHPLRESLWARLLVALDAAGRSADALAAYETVRSHIAHELGVDPGGELQRMHADLLAGISLADRPAALPLVPRQLPADIDDFAGRHEALHALDERDGLVVVHGAGGVGKTALVVHWANLVQPRFPDGQLFVDLRGYGPGEPMDPSSALDAMLRGLGLPGEQIPDGIDERGALFRTTIAGKRVLVVLDNALDAAHVEPLLPDPGTMTVLTSRSLMRRLDAHRIGLEVLPADDATTFLAERLTSQMVAFDNDSLAALAELCGQLPLALAVAAERAGRHPDSPLAELVQQLRDEQDRLDLLESGEDLATSLRAVMSWSYQALDADSARMFRLIGLFPGTDLGVPAAAALADVDGLTAARSLRRLADAHLLTSPRPGRYAMHDLVRIFAAERATFEDPAGDREATARRICQWYARSAESSRLAARTSQPTGAVAGLSFADARQATSWFHVEQHTVLGVIDESVRLGLHDEVIQLVNTTIGIHYLGWSVPADPKALLELAIAAARAAEDQAAEAVLLVQLGVVHARLGELALALPHFQAAETLYCEVDDPAGECFALTNIGEVHRHLGDPAEAIRHLERALGRARHSGQDMPAAVVLNNLANAYLTVSRHADAESAATEAIGIHRAAGRRLEEAFALDVLGTIHLARGDHLTAATCFHQAIDLHREIGGQAYVAALLRNLGRAQQGAGDVVAALASWQEALLILDETGAEDTPELSRTELRNHLAGSRSDAGLAGW